MKGGGVEGRGRAVPEPPLRGDGEVGMDSRLRGKNGWGEGLREADEIPRE